MSQTLKEEEKYEERHVYVNAGVIDAGEQFPSIGDSGGWTDGMQRTGEIGLTCCSSSLGEGLLVPQHREAMSTGTHSAGLRARWRLVER